MALYSLYQNKNEKMTGSFQKWYARPVVTDTKSLTDVALEIQENTTAKEADAYAVLEGDEERAHQVAQAGLPHQD